MIASTKREVSRLAEGGSSPTCHHRGHRYLEVWNRSVERPIDASDATDARYLHRLMLDRVRTLSSRDESRVAQDRFARSRPQAALGHAMRRWIGAAQEQRLRRDAERRVRDGAPEQWSLSLATRHWRCAAEARGRAASTRPRVLAASRAYTCTCAARDWRRAAEALRWCGTAAENSLVPSRARHLLAFALSRWLVNAALLNSLPALCRPVARRVALRHCAEAWAAWSECSQRKAAQRWVRPAPTLTLCAGLSRFFTNAPCGHIPQEMARANSRRRRSLLSGWGALCRVGVLRHMSQTTRAAAREICVSRAWASWLRETLICRRHWLRPPSHSRPSSTGTGEADGAAGAGEAASPGPSPPLPLPPLPGRRTVARTPPDSSRAEMAVPAGSLGWSLGPPAASPRALVPPGHKSAAAPVTTSSAASPSAPAPARALAVARNPRWRRELSLSFGWACWQRAAATGLARICCQTTCVAALRRRASRVLRRSVCLWRDASLTTAGVSRLLHRMRLARSLSRALERWALDARRARAAASRSATAAGHWQVRACTRAALALVETARFRLKTASAGKLRARRQLHCALRLWRGRAAGSAATFAAAASAAAIRPVLVHQALSGALQAWWDEAHARHQLCELMDTQQVRCSEHLLCREVAAWREWAARRRSHRLGARGARSWRALRLLGAGLAALSHAARHVRIAALGVAARRTLASQRALCVLAAARAAAAQSAARGARASRAELRAAFRRLADRILPISIRAVALKVCLRKGVRLRLRLALRALDASAVARGLADRAMRTATNRARCMATSRGLAAWVRASLAPSMWLLAARRGTCYSLRCGVARLRQWGQDGRTGRTAQARTHYLCLAKGRILARWRTVRSMALSTVTTAAWARERHCRLQLRAAIGVWQRHCALRRTRATPRRAMLAEATHAWRASVWLSSMCHTMARSCAQRLRSQVLCRALLPWARAVRLHRIVTLSAALVAARALDSALQRWLGRNIASSRRRLALIFQRLRALNRALVCWARRVSAEHARAAAVPSLAATRVLQLHAPWCAFARASAFCCLSSALTQTARRQLLASQVRRWRARTWSTGCRRAAAHESTRQALSCLRRRFLLRLLRRAGSWADACQLDLSAAGLRDSRGRAAVHSAWLSWLTLTSCAARLASTIAAAAARHGLRALAASCRAWRAVARLHCAESGASWRARRARIAAACAAWRGRARFDSELRRRRVACGSARLAASWCIWCEGTTSSSRAVTGARAAASYLAAYRRCRAIKQWARFARAQRRVLAARWTVARAARALHAAGFHAVLSRWVAAARRRRIKARGEAKSPVGGCRLRRGLRVWLQGYSRREYSKSLGTAARGAAVWMLSRRALRAWAAAWRHAWALRAAHTRLARARPRPRAWHCWRLAVQAINRHRAVAAHICTFRTASEARRGLCALRRSAGRRARSALDMRGAGLLRCSRSLRRWALVAGAKQCPRAEALAAAARLLSAGRWGSADLRSQRDGFRFWARAARLSERRRGAVVRARRAACARALHRFQMARDLDAVRQVRDGAPTYPWRRPPYLPVTAATYMDMDMES